MNKFNEFEHLQKNIRLFFESVMSSCNYCGKLLIDSDLKHFCNKSCSGKHQWKNNIERKQKTSLLSKLQLEREYSSGKRDKTKIFKAAHKKTKEMWKNGTQPLIKYYKNNDVWSKGKTKFTDSRIFESSKRMSGLNNPSCNRTKEEVIRFSNNMKNFWKEHPEKHPNRIMAKKGFISKPQKEMYATILLCFEDAILEYPLITKNGVKFLDVAVPSLKLCFEYDGEYWHKDKKEQDKIREQGIVNEGWMVVRFNEKNINNLQEVLNNIIE